jgi:hypothetical protein
LKAALNRSNEQMRLGAAVATEESADSTEGGDDVAAAIGRLLNHRKKLEPIQSLIDAPIGTG